MIKTEEKNNILRSAIWTTNSKVIGQIMSLATTLILVRFLTKDDFGLMAMVLIYTGLIDNFIDLGFLSAIVQAKTINVKQLSSCFWILMAISLSVCIVTLFLAPFIAMGFAESRLTGLVRYASLVLVFVPSNVVCKGILYRNLRLDITSKVELYSGVARTVASIFFAYEGMGVFSLVYGFLLEKFILAVALSLSSKWYPRFVFDGKDVGQLMPFGLKASASSILWYIYSRADTFVIGRLLSAEVLGVYTIAAQFPQAIGRLIPETWVRISYPLFSRYQQTDKLNTIFTKSSAQLTFICLPLFVGLSSIAPDTVIVLFGKSWNAAAVPLKIISISAALQAMTYLFPTVLNAIGHPEKNAIVNFFAAIVFFCVFYVSAYMWGLYGILWSGVILCFLRYLVFLLITVKLARLTIFEYLLPHKNPIIAVTVMFYSVIAMCHIGIDWNIHIRLFSCLFVGAFVYLGILAVTSRNMMIEMFHFIKNPAS